MKFAIQLLSRHWHWVTAFILSVITLLSLTPLPTLPEVPGSDKAHHLVAYAALMFPAFMSKQKSKFVLMLVFALWSGAIELIQPFVNRYGEWFDLAANISGLAIGAVLGWLFTKFYSATVTSVD